MSHFSGGVYDESQKHPCEGCEYLHVDDNGGWQCVGSEPECPLTEDPYTELDPVEAELTDDEKAGQLWGYGK